MGNWLGGVKLSDRALVRQAVGEAVATAREPKMTSLDEHKTCLLKTCWARWASPSPA